MVIASELTCAPHQRVFSLNDAVGGKARESNVNQESWLTLRFEQSRPRLRGVACRLLGSSSEAEDAVQEAWLRLNRSNMTTVQNLDGWLTTVVSRVCLDMLRWRKTRREQRIGAHVTEPGVVRREGADPESDAVLADAVAVALAVVRDRLTPAAQIAFVLHDLFAWPFDEIGSILGRSESAAKQLASRARRRVRGSPTPSDPSAVRQRKVVDAFLKAARAGDLEALLAVLDPDDHCLWQGSPGDVHGQPLSHRSRPAFVLEPWYSSRKGSSLPANGFTSGLQQIPGR